MDDIKINVMLTFAVISALITVGRWSGILETGAKVTAAQLDKKADKAYVDDKVEAMNSTDLLQHQLVTQSLSDIRRVLDEVRIEQREEHRKRGELEDNIGVVVKALAIDMATIKAEMVAINARVKVIEDRRREIA